MQTIPPFRKHQCKICKSPLCDQIDAMIRDKAPYDRIIEWAKKVGKLSLTRNNISNHNVKHRMPSLDQMNFDPNDVLDENGKPHGHIMKNAHKIIREVGAMTISDFLNLVIAKATKSIVTGDYTPNVTEAVKAAELKQKMQTGNPFEEEIVKYFKSISQEMGLTQKEKNPKKS